ncbi:putative Embryo sac development arrest 6 [Melia azedarach]|uniref:Embryo sac development arrest 6 n=1 Tax=Melia azedarach TaxID=155640 RepID=A0ACC1YI01_MELAZ|nr:putative Embryo sac development arrest 6 [Melia azedarach]
MSHHPRRILTPGASRKRKERETYYPFKFSAPAQAQAPAAANVMPSKSVSPEPVCPNRLLAGYMAYEFLSKGTLFGQKFDPARAEALPLVGSSVESKRTKPEGAEASASPKKEQKSYAEVASILKTDGAHIPGIVNPTQLARWIEM